MSLRVYLPGQRFWLSASEWIQQSRRAPEGALLGQDSGEPARHIIKDAALLIEPALQTRNEDSIFRSCW